jgi:hypothetical protein
MAKKDQGVAILDDAPVIETVAESADFSKLAADEAFMNEMVEIMVHSTTDENQPSQFLLNCNGVNQPVVRGINMTMKRKYVEILARMKETKYTQHTPNPAAPDVSELRARHGLVYPFDLIKDNNPKGRAWLSNVLAEPA